MKRPLVSVLMPLRDASPTLEAALLSVLKQTFKSIEIVAVNHGSRDETASILAAWAKRDPRLRVVHQPKGSLLDALNKGLRACRSPWVARADGDDLSRPDRLRAQLDFALKKRLDLVGAKVSMFPRAQIRDGYLLYEKWVNSLVAPSRLRRDLFVECPMPHPTWLVRKSLYQRVGGYCDDSLPEDYHFLFRAVTLGAKLGKVPRRLVAWREYAGRHSRTHPRYCLDAFFHLKARYLQKLFLKKRPCLVWGVGRRGRILTKYLKKEGVEVLLGVHDRRAKGNKTLRGVPVVLPGQWGGRLPAPIIACVGTPGAREQIRAWCRQRQLREGRDVLFAH